MTRSCHDLSMAEVLEQVSYNPESGVFTWIGGRRQKGAHRRTAGAPASRKAASGYLAVTISGVPVLCHRLAWFITYGAWPTEDVDHANGNRQDNRIANLRHGDRSFNMQNLKRSHRDSASQILGAHFDRRRGRWMSSICKQRRTKFLGYFDTAEEAGAAYLAAKRRLHEGCTI